MTDSTTTPALDLAVNELKSWAGEYCADSDCEYGRDMALGRHSKHCGILTNAIADISEGIRSLREANDRMSDGLRRWCEAFQALIPEEARARVDAEILGLREEVAKLKAPAKPEGQEPRRWRVRAIDDGTLHVMDGFGFKPGEWVVVEEVLDGRKPDPAPGEDKGEGQP